jgi:glycerol-3-phosphate dehydrogenase
MPITESVVDLLNGKISAIEAIARLMARDPTEEVTAGG